MRFKTSYSKLLIRLFILLLLPFAATAQTSKKADNKPVYGKYGCTSSRYSGGQVQYTPKGSFVIKANGTYTYYGFKEPSNGKFTVDKAATCFLQADILMAAKPKRLIGQTNFFSPFPGCLNSAGPADW
jgi:hypothetical protein